LAVLHPKTVNNRPKVPHDPTATSRSPYCHYFARIRSDVTDPADRAYLHHKTRQPMAQTAGLGMGADHGNGGPKQLLGVRNTPLWALQPHSRAVAVHLGQPDIRDLAHPLWRPARPPPCHAAFGLGRIGGRRGLYPATRPNYAYGGVWQCLNVGFRPSGPAARPAHLHARTRSACWPKGRQWSSGPHHPVPG